MAARTGWRRIVGFFAMLGAVALLAHQTCASQPAAATIVVSAPAGVEVDLRLLPRNETEQLGYYRGAATGDPGRVSWPVTVAEGSYDLSITTLGERGTTHVTRPIDIRDRATVYVDSAAAPEAEPSAASPETEP